ncbi:hypothetical protein DV737_g2006, partial [Chaetothyriales sp. CBS 132003]
MGEGVEGDEEDEDSEIESEDAFGSSDDERFEGWRFSGSRGRSRGDVENRNEKKMDEEEQDDYDDDGSLGDDAVDLATAWDMDDQDQLEETGKQLGKKVDKEETQGDMGNGSSTKEAKQTKISASDLLQYVNDPTQRQSLKILQSTERTGPEEYKGGIPGRLAAPLPKRQQDRVDRSAAYEQSKKELGKWVDTVKQNRRAEHLHFPLVGPNDPIAHASRQLPQIQGKPMTELEKKVQEIMAESGMVRQGSEMEREEDDLAEQKVSFEEIQARRSEMRKQRDLLFREEVKARRIKKIKSKAYRRIHRKEKARMEAEKRADDVLRGEVDSEEERERQERIRAEERMGRRHRESKWAKGAKETGKGKWDDGTRAAMEDMARRDEELRRRVDGREKNDDGWASDDGSSDYDSEGEEDETLEAKLLHLERQANDGPSSKLGSMAFMQRAEAVTKARNDAEIQELRRQLNGQGNGDFDPDADVQQSVGRQKFGVENEQASTHPPKRPVKTSEFEERLSDADLSGHEDTRDISTKPASLPFSRVEPPVKPLSTAFSHSAKQSAKVNGTGARQHKQQGLIKSTKPHETALDNYTSSSESEPDDKPDDEPDNEPVGSEKAARLTLADDIFAGDDDVIKEFQKEKQEVVLAEGDQIIDNALPGWGSWTGAGISKKAQNRTRKKFLTTIKGIAPEKRQDAKLEKVIVNEKRVKKNGKYLATELPHPFESRQQYERSLRLPLGPEWTTKSTFQDATKPRVVVKQGIIRAIQRPTADDSAAASVTGLGVQSSLSSTLTSTVIIGDASLSLQTVISTDLPSTQTPTVTSASEGPQTTGSIVTSLQTDGNPSSLPFPTSLPSISESTLLPTDTIAPFDNSTWTQPTNNYLSSIDRDFYGRRNNHYCWISVVTSNCLEYEIITSSGVSKYKITLEDDRVWLIYAISDNGIAPNFELVSSTMMKGINSWSGMIQIAKLPSGANESVYDMAAGTYPTAGSISGYASGDVAQYSLSWSKGGPYADNTTLLMFALPHHVQSFDNSTQGNITDVCLDTLTKGVGRAVSADYWVLEEQLPTDMGFAPWRPDGQTKVLESMSTSALAVVQNIAAIEASQNMSAQTNLDSMYYSGKGLSKFATLVFAMNNITGQEYLASSALAELKAAFNVFSSNQQQYPLLYDLDWKGVVSSASYVTGDSGVDFGNSYYNDHHFHYGYFLHAASIIGYLDPSWLAANKDYVNTLARDTSNPSALDQYFPIFRHFDFYNGHSWAKGLFESGDGKDEESSSEDAMHAYGLKMWGRTIGDASMEARGNLMLAVLSRSLQNYFLLDSSNVNQPAEFIGNKVTGILFENKVDHVTYFGTNLEYIQGIHMIPIMPFSTLMRTQQFVAEEWATYFADNATDPAWNVSGGWKGILYANLGIVDPTASLEFFTQADFDSSWLDGGATRTWYICLSALLGGQL